MVAERRPADLGVGPLELPARGGDAAREHRGRPLPARAQQHAREIGRDEFGNLYFQHKKDPRRRWVMYAGANDGSGVPPEVARIGRIPGIEILGFVENITPIFNRCRLSIAPLRFGAGIGEGGGF